MRAFITILPPPSVTEQLQALGERVHAIDRALRCEHADKLHFTLEFLGEKDESWLEACRAVIARIAAEVPPFPVAIRSIGIFPGKAHPRIIWAGSQPAENPLLCSLASSVKQACIRLGHAEDEKPFHPHITLTRVKQSLAPARVDRIAALTFDPLAFTCTEISVMKSSLHPDGSTYERVYTIPLRS
jgi:RNA 2',3'-cyclic 3'-phosphodiesterase